MYVRLFAKLFIIRCEFLGAIAGLGAGLLGNWFGNHQAAKREQNMAQYNTQQQERFYKNSMQWRVEDAKKAGLHPLAALGATGASYTPAYNDAGGDGGLGNQLVGATESLMGRKMKDPAAEKATKLELDRMELENEKLRKEINSFGQSAFGVLGNTGNGVNGASTFGNTNPNNPVFGVKSGRAANDFLANLNNLITMTPEKDLQDLVSERTLEYVKWALNNSHSPAAGQRAQMSLEKELKSKGAIGKNDVIVWRFDPIEGNQFQTISREQASKLGTFSDWRHPDYNAGYFSGKDSWGK